MPGESGADKKDLPQANESVYSHRFLRLYDTLVYRFNMPLLWRCRLKRFTQQYAEYLTPQHLEVGVGTGYLLNRSEFPAENPQITLMDVSVDPLEFTARRLERYSPRTHQASVVSPWELPANSFESVAMSNVLHCVPGTLREKAVAFEEARSVLVPGGVLFGSTVLGEDAEHTRRSRAALKKLNQRGVFNNSGDRLEDLDAGLGRSFSSHEIEVEGVMALFVAHV